MPTYNESFTTTVDAVKARAEALAATAEAKDLVFLGKTLEALNMPQTTSDIVDEGDFQVARVTDEGDTQWARVSNEGVDQILAVTNAGQAQIDNIEELASIGIIEKSDGDTLTQAKINILVDGGTVTLPLASTVADTYYIIVEQPETYRNNTPTVQAAGSDTIRYSGGTDTSVIINAPGAVTLRFVSDGVSEWRI